MMRNFGMGRLPAPDPRDSRHQLRTVTPLRAAMATRYWRTGPVLDQGSTSQCVAYSWTQFITSAPLMSKVPVNYPADLYNRAQQLDEFAGESYEGTSVRGGVKALQEQGRVSEYLWSTDADECRRYVLSRGCAVLGIDWPESFFTPVRKSNGMYLENPESPIAGGHAILVCGYSEKRKAFRLLNSWGATWGAGGRAWMRFDVLADRLSLPFAEFCSATEVRPT